jgi:hypothetical protein
MTIEAVTDSSLRSKWLGLLGVLLVILLLWPSTLDRIPAPMQQKRELAQELPPLDLETLDVASIFEPFPFPEALEPQVAFWRDIFAIYTTDHLVIHDNWYLPVVYEVVDMGSAEYASKAEGGARPRPRRKNMKRC